MDVIEELRLLDPEIAELSSTRDAGARLTTLLPAKYRPAQVVQVGGDRAWELAGLILLNSGRFYEALGVFWGLYQQMLEAQAEGRRVHKGMPLVWISECFYLLGFPVHAKRYLMLTLCEDAILGAGVVPAATSGVYFRLVWRHGLADNELQRYAKELFELARATPDKAYFPEALLQEIDDSWATELPSPNEAFSYRVNPRYVEHLLATLGDGTGKTLERLGSYLMSCMPGCRTRRRQQTPSTDYDVICAIEGIDVDFRSEFGRHFVCECKDLTDPADFTTMAKFCRVLDSTKSRFGILFAKHNISGVGKLRYADREQMKIFQDRGIVIVVLDESDLKQVAAGANLIAILRERYEEIRLDLYS
jgi:hypothetical protein